MPSGPERRKTKPFDLGFYRIHGNSTGKPLNYVYQLEFQFRKNKTPPELCKSKRFDFLPLFQVTPDISNDVKLSAPTEANSTVCIQVRENVKVSLFTQGLF